MLIIFNMFVCMYVCIYRLLSIIELAVFGTNLEKIIVAVKVEVVKTVPKYQPLISKNLNDL